MSSQVIDDRIILTKRLSIIRRAYYGDAALCSLQPVNLQNQIHKRK